MAKKSAMIIHDGNNIERDASGGNERRCASPLSRHTYVSAHNETLRECMFDIVHIGHSQWHRRSKESRIRTYFMRTDIRRPEMGNTFGRGEMVVEKQERFSMRQQSRFTKNYINYLRNSSYKA